MYATIAFSISLLGLFSFFENIKGNQKFSLLKYHMLLLIITLSIVSFMDYLDFSGYHIPYYKQILRFLGTLLLMNLLFLIVVKKIPKSIVRMEMLWLVVFMFESFYGFQFPEVVDGKILLNFNFIHKIFYALFFLIILSAFIYLVFMLYKNKDNRNLYDKKVANWVGFLIFTFLILILVQIIIVILNLKGIITFFNDSIVTVFFIRFTILLFILFRPKFLDDDSLSIPFNKLLTNSKNISFQDFEFLFYSNHYYLNTKASLEDFSLKLNHSKEEVTIFVKTQLDQNFTDLLNQNRVEYLKQLLRSKKFESFTIEALSEMSGFGTRRSMYNSFNKYVGMTPGEFINTLN